MRITHDPRYDVILTPETVEVMDKATREISKIKKSIKVPVAKFTELVHAL